jgi:hypothetical protein
MPVPTTSLPLPVLTICASPAVPPSPALHAVVAIPSLDDIAPGAARTRRDITEAGEGACADGVIAVAGVNYVAGVATARLDDVVSGARCDDVHARAAAGGVVAIAGVDEIVAGACSDVVVAGPADHNVAESRNFFG